MGKGLVILTVVLILLIGSSPEILAEDQKREEITEEELIFMEVQVVVTAARKEQPVTEAPAAVTVITAEDIKQSGALTVPDVLRMVSGVDVMTISARDQQVGIRGFNSPIHNKVLVMIDGRSVYTDFVGDIYWQLFPIPMEEIERIEVIKSPISSLYGANAFSGVINIITKTPHELKGAQINLTVGNADTYIGSLLHASEREKFHYKLSAGFDRTDVWDSGEKGMKVFRGNFSLGYDLGPEHVISLSGGRTHFEDLRLFVIEAVGTLRQKGDFDYLQADYRYGRLNVRTFWKAEDINYQMIRTGMPDKWDVSTYDTEARYSFDAGQSHSFVIGADYRYITLDKNNIIPADHSQNLWALFLEDEFRITDKWRLVAGARFDQHPLAKDHLSPRGTLLYLPTKDHTFRLSVSKAFRNPSFFDSYMFIEDETTLTLPPPFPPSGVPLLTVVMGNTELKSEGITSYELGYRTAPVERVVLSLNLFYNKYSDLLISTTETAFYGANELFPGSPEGVIPKKIIQKPQNGDGAREIGGEIDLNIALTEWLSAFTNYSYERITDKEDNSFTLTVNEKNRVRTENPKHKVNAGVRMKFKNGVSASLLAHWVDETERLILDLDGNEHMAKVDAYTLINARLGYTFLKGRAEASIYAFNLFNDMHFEYPPGINLPDRSSDEIGRKIVFKISYHF